MGRKHFRAKLCIPTHCHVIDPPHHPTNFSATTQDISVSGMQALMPYELPAGTSLRIDAHLQVGKVKHVFSAVGKVLRAHPVRSPEVSPKLFPVAVRFVSFRKGGPEILESFMARFSPEPAS